mmetsp:Transcript_21486/g.65661  ORF Transcript_21486/g.65661 Transcript_21486/m.65661 type:complete len:259 (+) Transcript_21486:313-1089(+)|eukprot:CAMPEP_0118851972 /NCGR_PEP_ID=MMETSP1163-20130328/1189_1 /TAXON_ID=124430 /ORGANISM="Phaeomonas parva, Strain CCMP2877" /LENGTH=258 /DNA_ID=CAMNT_0006784371 /DNA_START=298 /DNA_END=1074 /DNA_ORIENTATION=-
MRIAEVLEVLGGVFLDHTPRDIVKMAAVQQAVIVPSVHFSFRKVHIEAVLLHEGCEFLVKVLEVQNVRDALVIIFVKDIEVLAEQRGALVPLEIHHKLNVLLHPPIEAFGVVLIFALVAHVVVIVFADGAIVGVAHHSKSVRAIVGVTIPVAQRHVPGKGNSYRVGRLRIRHLGLAGTSDVVVVIRVVADSPLDAACGAGTHDGAASRLRDVHELKGLSDLRLRLNGLGKSLLQPTSAAAPQGPRSLSGRAGLSGQAH